MKIRYKLPFYQSTTTAILYVLVYLIKSFVIWKFTNPIQWILDMPTYSDEQRLLILFSWMCYTGMSYLLIYQIIDQNKNL